MAAIVSSFLKAKLPEYNSLFDHNLRQHFESKAVQRFLYKNALVGVV